ncbi:MAG TPA: pyridoxal 5'-phosphate synthase [Beutenbergiaceae bacterium]|nr:pyridoxal 5'-phosphate synthase [Beutenbergiaceae bacterium]
MPTTPSSTWRERLRALPVLSEPIGTLDLDDLPATPGQLFTAWLNDAIAARVPEPHVMTLSTVDGDGLPNARTVILTDVAEDGWSFSTDTLSAKVEEIAVNPQVALTFYWPALGRQVRVQGRARQAAATTSAADFAARSAHARAVILAAHDLARTTPDWDRADLLRGAEDRLREGPSGLSPAAGPLPWAAYVVRPARVEFWQADPGRLHQRVVYTFGESGWARGVLPH